RGSPEPTEFWEVTFGGYLWQFDNSDFEYALKQVSIRSLLNDKVIALSLAFHLYLLGQRKLNQRVRLKKAVAGNVTFEHQLNTYLKPPARGPDPLKQWERKSK